MVLRLQLLAVGILASLAPMRAQTVGLSGQVWLGVSGGGARAPDRAGYGEFVGFIPTLSVMGRRGWLARLDAELALQAGVTLDGFLGAGAAGIDTTFKPYRLWVRYAAEKFDLRLGLQKLVFGPGRLPIRPLAWFDTFDLRDPTGQTGGVTTLRARLFPSSGLTLWGWINAGHDLADPSPGGRAEMSFGLGELALSYHCRQTTHRDYASRPLLSPLANEERFALDLRVDGLVGLWGELAIINSRGGKEKGVSGTGTMTMIGGDYTLDLGPGLYVMVEHLWGKFSISEPELDRDLAISLSWALASYPLGLTDQVMGIVGYDWESGQGFGFAQWQRTFDAVSLHVILTGSPAGGSDLAAGQSQSGAALTSFGVAIQFMMIYNY